MGFASATGKIVRPQPMAIAPAASSHGIKGTPVPLPPEALPSCRLLVSEDGQDGRTLGGVTIINPFGPTPSPLLAQALDAST
jgi:hypothetical protein